MTFLTLEESDHGWPGLPAGHRPVARDDLGDLLTVDEAGGVRLFQHGMGMPSPQKAFASLEQMHAYMAFQEQLNCPSAASLDELKARKERVVAFGKSLRGAPYAKAAVRDALSDLREAIADAWFAQSKRGRGIAERQVLGARCEQALRDAGVPGGWTVRAHVSIANGLVAMGPCEAPWTEATIRAALAPLLGERWQLVVHAARA